MCNGRRDEMRIEANTLLREHGMDEALRIAKATAVNSLSGRNARFYRGVVGHLEAWRKTAASAA